MCWLKPAIKPTTLPHPQEAMNPSQTVANTNPDKVMFYWFQQWNVPPQYWDFWKNQVKLYTYDAWLQENLALGIHVSTPAYAIDRGFGRELHCLARWLNPGVIAHEQAHNSYSLLTPSKVLQFSVEYRKIEKTDTYLKLLYSQNTYAESGIVEAHAEMYRYIAHKMPNHMKSFYPKLF